MNTIVKLLAPIITALLLLTASPQVVAQATRDCASTAADPDGDGFGWEWNADAGQLASCVITAASYSPPSQIINRESGEEVRLIRPYWNANRDIAGRNIQCKGYTFDETQGRYTNKHGFYDTSLSHEALPHTAPYMAAANFDRNPYFISPDDVIYKVWTVIDGRYIGPMMGRMSNNYTVQIYDWLEIIAATDTQPAGIRIWGSDPTYRECFDQSGQSFGPTGFIGEELPTEEVQIKSLIATGKPAPDYAEPIINLETGQAVDLSTAHWDVYKSFWGRKISCWPTQWDGNQYYPLYYSGVRNRFYAANTGEQSGFVGTRFGLGGGDGGTSEEWNVVDGKLSVSGFWSMTIYDKLEAIPATDNFNAHVRSWHSSESYTVCTDNGGLVGPYSTDERRDLKPLDPGTIQTGTNTQDTDPTSTQETDDNLTEPTAQNINNDAPTNINETSSNSSGGGTMTLGLLLSLLVLQITRKRQQKHGQPM